MMILNNQRWLLDNNNIFDEDSKIVAVIPPDVELGKKKLLEGAPEAFALIQRFVTEVRGGKLKARTMARDMEVTLAKYLLEC